MNNNSKTFFETAYKTGADSWTNLPYSAQGQELLKHLGAESFILDVGCGRGRWVLKLGELGFKAIGLDYAKNIIEKNNEEVKNKALAGRVAFMEGDVFNIPLADSSLDAVTDFALFQHIEPDEWQKYKMEILRVLKPGGYFFAVALSKDTVKYLNWNPKTSGENLFRHEGVPFYFFTKDKFEEVFSPEFEPIEAHIDLVPPKKETAIISVLFRKK